MTTRFRGHDELGAWMNAGFWTLCNTALLGYALVEGGLTCGALWLAGVLLTPVIYFGARFRVVVSPRGIEVTRYHLWPLWRTRQRFYLDAEVSLFEAWESDRPEGIYVASAAIGSDDSEPFGPYWDRLTMEALRLQIAQAIDRERIRAAHPRKLNHPDFDPDDFDVLEWSPGGPPRRLRSRVAVRVGGAEIGAGSKFRMNRRGWVDPARTDELSDIELSGDTVLPHGLVVRAGGVLFYTSWRPGILSVRGGLRESERVGSVIVDGNALLELDSSRNGQPVRFTLARPIERGDLRLPAGSELHRTRLLDDVWSVRLGAALAMPDGEELGEGDTIYFDLKWKPTMISRCNGEITTCR